MLEGTRDNPKSLAWWRVEERSKALIPRRWSSEPEPGQLSFFSPDFALNSASPWLVGQEIDFPQVSPLPLPPLMHRADPSAADFERLHEEILGRIRRHEFEKVVPIICEDLEFQENLSYRMFPRCLDTHEHQFSYGFDFEGEGLVGVTPELLFAVKDGVLQTMALAGTGPADGPSLLEDPKEIHEHEVVIAHIFSEVKAWGSVEVGTTQERVFGRIKHLYTPLRVDLNRQPQFLDLVVKLHPTAALGGWPRRAAVEWLEEQSFHTERGRFGAPFGYQADDEMLCVVAIRGLQWHETSARISAGCGVVRESQALKEWQELALKRNSTYRHVGLDL